MKTYIFFCVCLQHNSLYIYHRKKYWDAYFMSSMLSVSLMVFEIIKQLLHYVYFFSFVY
jgi:hypothetical protein